ncbi:DUF5994 family protein [Nocardia sp. CDC159]|uniref:DUF5994 family protein n=1 Tax=Nocardia pulmonis TaxID=2951408 RepID=A0A9X2EBJ6_9NOCA|nr:MULTISPECIES: DUF5994 family protein [Nocardia]MCM6777230.1 DUF5994 family protein [Nocardia pulmonis]MCM6790115.1 DUF5994 family protein [Nocardia sp. CDC159]
MMSPSNTLDRSFASGTAGGPTPVEVWPAAPRLMMRERNAATGPIDGAWWLRTANPMTELHEVVGVLAPSLGRLARVGFDWKTATSIHSGEAGGIMHLFGLLGVHLALLVVPADTASELAAIRMRWASGQSLPEDWCDRRNGARAYAR